MTLFARDVSTVGWGRGWWASLNRWMDAMELSFTVWGDCKGLFGRGLIFFGLRMALCTVWFWGGGGRVGLLVTMAE